MAARLRGRHLRGCWRSSRLFAISFGENSEIIYSGPAFAAPGLSRSSGMAPHASSAVRGAARFAAMAFPLGLFRCLAQCVAPGSASLAICLTAGALAFRFFSG